MTLLRTLLVIIMAVLSNHSHASTYEDMRRLWLDPSDLPGQTEMPYIGEAQAYSISMELTQVPSFAPNRYKRVSVLANFMGEASFYFEADNEFGMGGFMGGGASHANIRKDAIAMIDIATKKISLMKKTGDYPSVTLGHVRFILATKNGPYTVELEENEVRKQSNPFYNLYDAGQQIISDYILLNQKESLLSYEEY